MLDTSLLIGTAGAICILTGFLLVQRHIWSQDSLRYDLLNLAGSLLLLAYAWMGEVWPFVLLNVVWALYSLKDIASDVRARPGHARKGG